MNYFSAIFNFIKKHAIFFLLGVFLFCLFFSQLQPLGIYLDYDSHTYTYLVNQNLENAQFYTSQRPFIYPLELYLLAKLTSNYESLALITNILLRSVTIKILAWLIFKTSKSFDWTAAGTIFLVTNLQLSQFINFLIPETLLVFLIALNILLVRNYLINDSKKNTLLVMVSLFLLTFTKPIFLFFPIIFLLTYLLKNYHHEKLKQKFIYLLILFFVFQILPIISWIFYNNYTNQLPKFSIIGSINLTGKIMQYNLVESGPSDEYFLPLKASLLKEGDYCSIFCRFDLIFASTPQNKNPFMYMDEFSKKTVLTNLPKFFSASLNELPKILSSTPASADEIYHHSLLSPSPKNLLDSLYFYTWGIGSKLNWLILVITVSALIKIWISHKHLNFQKIDLLFYFYLLLSIAYIYLMIAFTAYDSYARLKSVADDVVVVAIILSLNIIFRKKLKKEWVANET